MFPVIRNVKSSSRFSRLVFVVFISIVSSTAVAGTSASPNPSTDGDYTVSWTSITGADDYKLFESSDGGTNWTQIYIGPNLSKSIVGKAPGTYKYDLDYCFWWDLGGPPMYTCVSSGFTIVDVDVEGGPAIPLNLTGHDFDFDGEYDISWDSAEGAEDYELEEKIGTGSWTNVYDGTSTSASLTKTTNDPHEYRVRGCDTTECSDWSATHLTEVEVLDNIEDEVSLATADAVGTTPFFASVDGKGNGLISIPLQLPPGVNGMKPELSLSYSSGAAPALVDDQLTEGTLGYGWGLSGVTVITRCRVSIGGSVNYSTTDTWCLDGQALIRISGSNNMADNAEFRTENQTFVKVAAKGTGIANRYFEVEMPDGRTVTYGDTDESRVIADGDSDHLYLLTVTKDEDEFGNEILFTWEESDTLGTNYLTEIEYDDTYVVFEYGERCSTAVNCDVSLVQNGENVPGVEYRGVVLNRVRSKIGTSWVSDYRLDSNYSSGYLRLDKVQQCAYNETGSSYKCLEPLEFAWDILTVSRFDDDRSLNVVEKVTNGFDAETEFAYAVIDGTGTGNHSYHIDAHSWFGTYAQPANLTTQSGQQRAILDWFGQPDGRGGSTITYYSYQGYPLYSTKGRGFAGFPSTRTEFLNRRVFDASTETSFDTVERTYSQYRLDFPFIGRMARAIRAIDVDSSSSDDWKEIQKSEFGWETKSLHSGAVDFGYLARSYFENYELNSSGAVQIIQGIEKEKVFCFRDLTSGTCPISGTENEYPTQLTNITRVAEGLGSQGFGSVWGEVDDRTVSTQLNHRETVADYKNDTSSPNWVLGFTEELNSSYGATSVLETDTVEFEKEQASSLLVGEVTRAPNDANYELTTAFDYDVYGNLTTETVSGINVPSRTTTASLFEDHRYPELVTNALGQESDIVFDLRFGKPKTITDDNDLTVTVIRDEFGRPSSVTTEDGIEQTYTYGDCSTACSSVTWATARHVVTLETKKGVTKVAPTIKRYFDSNGNLVLTERDAFDSADGFVRLQRHYDDSGRIVKHSMPYHSVGGTAKYVERHYDFKGRPAFTDRPDDSNTTTEYVGAVGKITITTTESDSGNSKVSEYDSRLLLAESTDAFGTSDAVTTTYEYSNRLKLETVEVENTEVADIAYNSVGLRSSFTEPNSGTTTLVYDALEQLIQTTDAESQKTKFTYDKLNRLTERVDGYLGTGSVTNTWEWDSSTNGVGKLHEKEGLGYTETYGYSSAGQLNKTTTSINVSGFGDNGDYITEYGYDTAARLATVEYPNFTATYEYKSSGYRSKIKDGTTVLHETRGVDAFGNSVDELYDNDIQTIREYDPNDGRLTSIETGKSATPRAIQDLLLEWNSNGNLEKRTDQLGTSTSSDDRVETIVHDDLNRILTSTVSGSNRVLTTAYDDFGNINSKTSNVSNDLDITGYTYNVSGKPHRLASATLDGVLIDFEYDSNGNTIKYDSDSGDDTFIEYDARDQAVEVTVGATASTSSPTARDQFWYTPDGQRFLRKATWDNSGTLDTSWTLYLLGGRFEEIHPEYDSAVSYIQRVQVSDIVTHRYEHDGTSSSEEIDYIHRDHLGSIDAVTDSSGSSVRNRSFDPFGSYRESDWSADASSTTLNQIKNDADGLTGRGFTNHEHLNRTGIVHMNGRIYDARLGRFLQPDHFVQAPEFSQNFNRYAYVLNTPHSYADPTGQCLRIMFIFTFGDCNDGGGGGGGGFGDLPSRARPFNTGVSDQVGSGRELYVGALPNRFAASNGYVPNPGEHPIVVKIASIEDPSERKGRAFIAVRNLEAIGRTFKGITDSEFAHVFGLDSSDNVMNSKIAFEAKLMYVITALVAMESLDIATGGIAPGVSESVETTATGASDALSAIGKLKGIFVNGFGRFAGYVFGTADLGKRLEMDQNVYHGIECGARHGAGAVGNFCDIVEFY